MFECTECVITFIYSPCGLCTHTEFSVASDENTILYCAYGEVEVEEKVFYLQ